MAELNVANFWTMYIMRNAFSQDFPCQRFNPSSALRGQRYDFARSRGSRVPSSTDYQVFCQSVSTTITHQAPSNMHDGEGEGENLGS